MVEKRNVSYMTSKQGMHFEGLWLCHLAVSIATIPSTLYGSQTQSIHHAGKVSCARHTCTLQSGQQKLCLTLNRTTVHLVGAVDEHLLKFFGTVSHKLAHLSLAQSSMECEYWQGPTSAGVAAPLFQWGANYINKLIKLNKY